MQLQGRLTSTQEFENIILRTTDAGGLVRLKDVGRVELGGEIYGIDAMDLKGTPRLVLRSISSPAVTPSRSPMA